MTHIKLPLSFFDNDKLKVIRAVAGKNGETVLLLYTMLITVAAKSDADGRLMLCDDIPYDSKILSGILGFEEKAVKDGLDLLTKFGLLTLDNNTYFLTGYEDFIDSKGAKERKQNAERQAKFKAKQSDTAVSDSVTITPKKTAKATDISG